ncbi:hypothetical protein DF032_03240 [Burkholderia seminalis]|nr:hypothetical protein DF032_03240 [Burkholderia seminalis]
MERPPCGAVIPSPGRFRVPCPESGTFADLLDIRARSSESLVRKGATRARYIEIQNIACDLIEYA